MHTNIKIIVRLCVIAVCIVAIAIPATTKSKEEIRIEVGEIKSCKITLEPPGQEAELNAEQLKELVDLIDGLSMKRTEETFFRESNGQLIKIIIEKEDGTSISILESGDYMLLDEQCYQINQKSGGKISDFANKIK